MRWEKHKILDKRGKPLLVYTSGKEYQVCQDLRAPCVKGRWSEDWNFGVYFKGKYVAEAGELDRAKELADIHLRWGDDV